MVLSVFTLPNVLSGLRIVLVPVLLVTACLNMPSVFLGVLVVSLCSDGLDGYFARRFQQESTLGAKLDSWGDLFTYGAMVFGLYWLWPQIFQQEAWFLVLGVALYLLSTTASLFKFGELPRYHTWAAKIAAVLMAPAYFLLILNDMSMPFRAVILFHVWVAIEELLIVVILRRNRYNVPTFIHARNLTRRAKKRLQLQKEKLQERRERFQERRDERKENRRNSRQNRRL